MKDYCKLPVRGAITNVRGSRKSLIGSTYDYDTFDFAHLFMPIIVSHSLYKYLVIVVSIKFDLGSKGNGTQLLFLQ